MTDSPTMHAAVIDAYGPPEVLRVARVPRPEPGDGEVLVRVRAAGVNAIDWLSRAGHAVRVTRFPAVLGWDIAGTVVEAGPGAGRFAVGDRVFGTVGFPRLAGGYAEYVAAAADDLARIPDGLDDRTAAGAAMPALTAWESVHLHADIAAGQRVLVHGGAGGVGHVAVQLAALAGAEVSATASAHNHDFVTSLGARQVVDYTKERVEDLVKDVDVVIDTRGGPDFEQLLATLRPGGLIVTLKGERPDHTPLLRKHGVRAAYTYVAPDGTALDRVAPLLAEGRLRIGIQQALPLDGAAEAHRIGETGHVRGRIVLDVG
ncbi:NADP-dependent oxidoreductase [Streptomyces sp. NPDC092369]|uniref:NADP-dependent oxidoreductase n=1 Tax=Streptomyces sp. NPDC092369 TaxID=3366015 RepID=UPI003823115C